MTKCHLLNAVCIIIQVVRPEQSLSCEYLLFCNVALKQTALSACGSCQEEGDQ